MLRLVRRRETSFLTIRLRSGLNQRHLPVFAVEIKTTVGIAKRRRAQRAVFPLHLAGGELGAEQRLSGRAIQKISDFHRAANCRGKFRFEINLLRLDASPVDLEFDDTTAGAGRGAVDVTVAGERRRDVRAVTADRFPVTPQKPARLRLHPHETLLQELNVLLHAANLDEDGGSVGGFVAFRQRALPNDLTRALVQRDQRGRAAARRAQERVAVNQRRLGVRPVAGLAAEVSSEIFSPAHFARVGLNTGQIAIRSERIKELTLDRRRGAGGGKIRLLLGISHLAEGCPPDPVAIFDRERLDELAVRPFVAQKVEPVSDDGRRRVTTAGRRYFPKQFRSVLWPFLEQAGFSGNSVSLRSAPLRPVTGGDRQCSGQHEKTTNSE